MTVPATNPEPSGADLVQHVNTHREPVADCDWCPLPAPAQVADTGEAAAEDTEDAASVVAALADPRPSIPLSDLLEREALTFAAGGVVGPAAASPGTPEAPPVDLERAITYALTDSGSYFEAAGLDVITVDAAARIGARAVEAALAARDGEVRQLRDQLAAERDATVPYREVEAWLKQRRDSCRGSDFISAQIEAAALDDMLDDFSFRMETGSPLNALAEERGDDRG